MEFKWYKKFEIGSEKIDKQHQVLFEEMNNFLDACAKDRGRQEILNILNFLEKYVVEHFTDEEDLQRTINYPDYEYHMKLHENLKNQIGQIKEEIANDGVSVSSVIETNRMLVRWLVEHICNEDKAIGDYIRKNNLHVS